MTRFLLRRLLLTVVTLFAVTLIIFVLARVSGDPRYLLLDEFATQEQWEALKRKLGLDRPLFVQYAVFMRGIVVGDFGKSIRERKPVMDLIAGRVPASLQLAAVSFGFSILLGIPFGIMSAVSRGGLLDNVTKIVALVGQAAPTFWLGIMFIFFFAVKLGWVPPSGHGEWKAIILPAVSMGWFFVAANLRIMRSAMLDALSENYITLARAKGASRFAVVWKHGLRNAIIAPLTFAGVTLGGMLAGSLVIETVFVWPGLGRLAYQAVFNHDYPLLQGIVIIFTLIYLSAALVVDVLYAYIDPRIRYS